MSRRLWNVLIGLDQTVNAAGGGDPDETISSRTAKEAMAGSRWGMVKEAIIDLVFALVAGERHHCAASIEHDEGLAA